MADYIGARYTIKVYQNSLDPSSAEWENGFAYEPLTLVTHNNSSYLSKVNVPANIGSPDANPTYWVITGAYNGQILQLQNDVSALQNATAKLPGTKLMLGTEQFVTSPDGTKTFGQLLDDLYAQLDGFMTAHPDYKIRALSAGIAGAFGLSNESRLQASWSGEKFNVTIVTTSHVYNYFYDVESTGSQFYVSTDNNITDNTSVVADSNLYLNIEVYVNA